jgi:hypothetical protein
MCGHALLKYIFADVLFSDFSTGLISNMIADRCGQRFSAPIAWAPEPPPISIRQ